MGAAEPGEPTADRIAELVQMQARESKAIELTKSDLSALRAHLDVVFGHLADEMAAAREDAVAAADARVAGTETRLLSRLDDIAAAVTQTAQHSTAGQDVLARLGVLEQTTFERQAALEERVGQELRRLAKTVETLKAEAVGFADLDAVQGSEGHIESVSEQVAEVVAVVAAHSQSLDAARSRLETVERHIAEEMARLGTSPEQEHADPEALRSELEAGLTAMLRAQRTELEAALDARIGDTQTELSAYSGGAQQLARTQEDLRQLVDGLAERERQEAEAVERRIAGAVNQLNERVQAQQSELRASLEARVEQLQAVLDDEEARVAAAVDARMGPTQAELATLSAGAEQLASAQESLNRLVDGLGARYGEAAEAVERRITEDVRHLSERFEAQAAQVELLQAALDGASSRGDADVDAKLGETSAELSALLARTERLEQALAGMAETVSPSADGDGEAAGAVEGRIIEVVDELTERMEAGQAELQSALEARIEQLQTGLDQEAARAGADVARIASESESLGLSQEDLSRRFDEVIQRLEQLEARDLSGVATEELVSNEVARIEDQLTQRLDRLADSQSERIQSLENAVQQTVGRAETREFPRHELQEALHSGSDDVEEAARLKALEDHARQSDAEMSDLHELHGALDMGLGSLRSEIAELREAMRNLGRGQADLLDRADARPQTPPSAEPQGRGRRAGRRGDSGAELAGLMAATEALVREQRQLKADVATLDQEAQLARAAASRPPREPPGFNALRSDVTVLREKLAEQDEALELLRNAVASGPAKAPGRAPAAKKRAPRKPKDQSP